MNAKLIAIAAAAFVLGHDIAVTRANRRAAQMQAQLDTREKAAIMLRWFHVGREAALADKDAVSAAFNSYFPPPTETKN